MKTQIDDLFDIANAISRGEVPQYQHNDCYTAGAFDLLLVNVRGQDAFKLLQDVVQRYESVKTSGDGFRGYFFLLGLLAHQTNTTEMPSGLQAIIAGHPELSNELRVWYRLPS